MLIGKAPRIIKSVYSGLSVTEVVATMRNSGSGFGLLMPRILVGFGMRVLWGLQSKFEE